MDFSWWPFKNLLSLKDTITDDLLRGDIAHKATLKAIDEEIALRKFIVAGILDGKIVVEYERYRTKKEGEEWAAYRKLDIGKKLQFAGKDFEVKVFEI